MTKRILALVLAVLCTVCCLTGCHDRKIDGENVKGAEIDLYITDQVYELDPALCLNNDSAMQICGLLYDTLFVLDEDGKVQKSIVDSYVINKDEKNQEYTMEITLKDDNCWSDGTYVSAEDVIYSWKRILDPEFNSDAACLLYDIQNAAEAKQGDCSIDDVGIFAVDELVLRITFVGDIDYDRFILNLTSIALAPLREDVIRRNADWAKKPATTTCSGPFMLRRVNYGFDGDSSVDQSYASLVLERNPFYRRSSNDKYVDKSVTPYRLNISYADGSDGTSSSEQALKDFANGEIFYVGHIALSKRSEYKDTATVSDLLSTHTVYLNEDADIAKADGTTEKLFANKYVRLALSAAIDRQAIADKIVFAKAATGLVSYGVFNTTSAKEQFRTVGGDLISTSADLTAAKNYIAQSGITPSDYTFTLMTKGTNEVHVAIAEEIVKAWQELGFNVTLNAIMPTVNDEKYAGEDVKDIYDDQFDERFYANKYEAASADLLAASPDAFSVLAPFATQFSGQGQDMSAQEYIDVPNKTGFVDEDYNTLMDEIFAETDATVRAQKLHEAEEKLLESMPVIPIIFNQDAYLISSDLSGLKSTYYGYKVFTKVSQKNWINYVETVAPEDDETTEAP